MAVVLSTSEAAATTAEGASMIWSTAFWTAPDNHGATLQRRSVALSAAPLAGAAENVVVEKPHK
eukprot:95988-Rhodomonas_salina.1